MNKRKYEIVSFHGSELKELLIVLLFARFRIQVNLFTRENFDDTNIVRTTKKNNSVTC
jgi:hypothetical protein